jgi:hypothetical protein
MHLLSLLTAALFLLLPLALGGGCLWVAFELVRETKKSALSASQSGASPSGSGCCYPLAAFLAALGAAVLLLGAFAWWIILTWRSIDN